MNSQSRWYQGAEPGNAKGFRKQKTIIVHDILRTKPILSSFSPLTTSWLRSLANCKDLDWRLAHSIDPNPLQSELKEIVSKFRKLLAVLHTTGLGYTSAMVEKVVTWWHG
jgi:hypothetical protein